MHATHPLIMVFPGGAVDAQYMKSGAAEPDPDGLEVPGINRLGVPSGGGAVRFDDDAFPPRYVRQSQREIRLLSVRELRRRTALRGATRTTSAVSHRRNPDRHHP